MNDLSFLYSIGGVTVLLAILIFVHELGHFLVAKLSGVGVLKFSLGFGPKLLGRKIGETDYLISAIPLGGYVKMLGESDADEIALEDEKRSFLKQKVSKRIAIVAAGPLFNLLFAIIFFWIGYMIGIPVPTSEIGGVLKASVAEKAGLQGKDVITAVDSQKVQYWNDVADLIAKSNGKSLSIVIRRGSEDKIVSLTPQLVKGQNIFGEEVESFKIGILQSDKNVTRRENPVKGFWMGIQQTWYFTELTVVSLVKMVEGIVSPKTLGGPIMIAQLAGAQVKKGIVSFLFLTGLLSINLAILNLLPIPVLDGGHLFFNLIEIVIGREVNVKWREVSQQVGLFLLIMLMIFVFYNDIARIFSH